MRVAIPDGFDAFEYPLRREPGARVRYLTDPLFHARVHVVFEAIRAGRPVVDYEEQLELAMGAVEVLEQLGTHEAEHGGQYGAELVDAERKLGQSGRRM